MNESLGTVDGRSVVRIERWFRHPPEKVWQALTDPAELRHWFPSDVAIDLRPGGAVHFEFRHGEGPDLDGRVLELDRPRLFTFLWGDSVLRFELRPEQGADGPGCRLLFSHTFDDRVSAASYAAGWQTCFDNLLLRLGDKPADVGLEQWAARHDGYVKQFGLDVGTVEEVEPPGAGWLVRFERQLTRPGDEVWDRLTEGQVPAMGGPVPAAFTAGLVTAAGPVTAGRVAAGLVTAVEPGRLLEFSWRVGGPDEGRVRWELSPGNGGARLDLTQTFPSGPGDEAQQALGAWAEALESLARNLR